MRGRLGSSLRREEFQAGSTVRMRLRVGTPEPDHLAIPASAQFRLPESIVFDFQTDAATSNSLGRPARSFRVQGNGRSIGAEHTIVALTAKTE